MTPAEHLAEAERILTEIGNRGGLPNDSFYMTLVRVAELHALIAVAAELGVPHGETVTGGAAGAAVQSQPGS